MAAAGELYREMTFTEMIDSLVEMANPTINDQRQSKYCQHINTFLSHFGGERFMLVGSTREETRLHVGKDHGDYDFLIISNVVIPIECLQYNKDLPLFVHIDGIPLRSEFPSVELVHEKYLPSYLLSECKSEAFKHSCYLFNLSTDSYITHYNKSMNIYIGRDVKPGRSQEIYEGAEHPEITVTGKIQKDSTQTLQFVQDDIRKFYAEDESGIVGKVFHILKGLEQKKGDNVPLLYQQFGKVIDAFCTLCKLLNEQYGNMSAIRDMSILPSDMSSNTKYQSTRAHFNISCSDVSSNAALGASLKFYHQNHRDFIPAFSLSGKPKFLEAWKDRERYWPEQSVIDDIYNSEFFVVAKPAICRPNKLKDFCLAYNIAETKMAQAMTTVQRKVVHILKALQKSVLSKFSRILTTYHWKTVLYWTSEKWQPYFIMDDNEDTILLFLRKVLQTMNDCLSKQDLQHYFIPCNLFSDIGSSKAVEIVSKIEEIREDPIMAVYQFFATQVLVPPTQQYETCFSRKHIHKCKAVLLGTCVKNQTDQIISLLESFTTNGKQGDILNEAITDVFLSFLPHLKEESERDEQFEGREENVSLDVIFDCFSKYIMVPKSDKHAMKEAKDQLVGVLLELNPKNRRKMNLL